MPHECEDCGDEFQTLTRLRLHDCGETEPDSGSDDAGADHPASTGEAGGQATAERTADVASDLHAPVEDAAAGDVEALHATVATFESEMAAALDEGDPDRYQELFWEYYEPLADGLDAAGRERGWPLLSEFTGAYDPAVPGDDVPLAAPVVANAVGRYVVRTRLREGVAAVEPAALGYLGAIAENADTETPREESFVYGWGIGHPEADVAETIVERASDAYFWASAALERAFYADQRAAVDVLDRLLTDDAPDIAVPHPDGELEAGRFFLDAVAGADAGEFRLPRYWDLQAELDVAFAWDEEVRDHIRSLVDETGVEAELPADWTFADLGI